MTADKNTFEEQHSRVGGDIATVAATSRDIHPQAEEGESSHVRRHQRSPEGDRQDLGGRGHLVDRVVQRDASTPPSRRHRHQRVLGRRVRHHQQDHQTQGQDTRHHRHFDGPEP